MAEPLAPGAFIGESRSLRLSSGAILSEVRHRAARRLPRHSHQLAFISLLVHGRYEERWGGQTWSYSPLTGGYHPSAFTHDDEIGAGETRLLCVELEQPCVTRLAEIAPRALCEPRLLTAEGSLIAQRLFTAWRQRDRVSPLRLEGLILELLATLVESHESQAPSASRPAWLSRVMHLLADDSDRHWTVEEIARLVDRHPVHVARTFRQQCGQSIAAYLRDARVHRACELLAGGRATLTDIALRTGFADQSHLARVFKSTVGVTPGQYRDARRSRPR